MWRGPRARVAKICAYALGVGNLTLPVLAEPTALTLSLTVVLAPFTLAVALKLTAFLACGLVSVALGDHLERTELLVCVIAGLQPPIEGERYREAILAEVRAAPPHQVRAIRTDLLRNAPRTILAAWARPLRRTRRVSAERAGSAPSNLS